MKKAWICSLTLGNEKKYVRLLGLNLIKGSEPEPQPNQGW